MKSDKVGAVVVSIFLVAGWYHIGCVNIQVSEDELKGNFLMSPNNASL